MNKIINLNYKMESITFVYTDSADSCNWVLA